MSCIACDWLTYLYQIFFYVSVLQLPWALVHGKYRSLESFPETDLHKYAFFFFFSTLLKDIPFPKMHKYNNGNILIQTGVSYNLSTFSNYPQEFYLPGRYFVKTPWNVWNIGFQLRERGYITIFQVSVRSEKTLFSILTLVAALPSLSSATFPFTVWQ